MSFKEVKELRQSNQLIEAYELAKNDLAENLDDLWNKRSLAWVLYDYLKLYSSNEQYELFIRYLKEINELDLPVSDNMVFDNSAWQIGKIIFDINKITPLDYNKIDQIYSIINNFHFTKPSEAYSFLYKSFHKGYKGWLNYLTFADWWNFDCFREDDYEKEAFNGKSMMSIAEQAYIAYSKKLIEKLESSDSGFSHYNNFDNIKEKIKDFLPRLNLIIDNHPDYQYPQYFKVKLQISIGDRNNLLISFIPFARQKQNDFWVWELLSEIFSADPNKQIACLCKSLSCKSPNDFLVRVREHLTELLISRKEYPQAKYEIIEIIKTRNENCWRIPQKIQNWQNDLWFQNANTNGNESFYKQYSPIAEDILFEDIPEEIVVVEQVNFEKKILNFIKSKTKHGFFKYDKYFDIIQTGDILRVKFTPIDASEKVDRIFTNSYESVHRFYKILSASKTDDQPDPSIIKNFKGTVRISNNQQFGFVEDIFVEPSLINSNTLNNNDFVNGLALLSFNKKKNEWSYKAIRIINQNHT